MLERLTQEQLIEKFNPMIHSIIKKYTGVLEKEDLYQECCIAILEAYKEYDSSKAKLETYIYNTINWTCQNLARTNRKHVETISLQLLASNNEDDTTTLQDTLQDPVDFIGIIEDKLAMIFYKQEIRDKLNEEEAEAMIDKYFNECIGVNRNLLYRAKRNLIRRSFVFRNEYKKLKCLPDGIIFD